MSVHGGHLYPFSSFYLSISKVLLIVPVLLLVTVGRAQQSPLPLTNAPATPPDATSAPKTPEQAAITVPAGTRLALVLPERVNSKTLHPGDNIYAQITAPVVLGNQVVIPSGTFVEGPVENLKRHGSRGEFSLRSASLVFSNGQLAKISGPTTLESDEGTATRNPGRGRKVTASLAPLAGFVLGTVIGGAAQSTTRNIYGQTVTTSSGKGRTIGGIAGLGAGMVVALTLRARSHDFYVESGSPVEITLDEPVTVSKTQVKDAINNAPVQPPTGTRRTPGGP